MTEATARRASTAGLLTAILVGGLAPILNTTLVPIGTPAMIKALHASVSMVQWVTTGYLLALAVAIPLVSWAQGVLGGKRVWMIGLGLFTLGAGLSAFAWDVGSLVAFRAVQGLGGGVIMPLMMTLAMQHIDREKMARTMATVSVPIALAPIFGPVIGGVVLHWLDWRWLFAVSVPFGLIGLLLAARFLPDDAPGSGDPRPRFDLVGVALMVPAFSGMLYGLSRADSADGFAAPEAWVPIAAGLLLLVAFAWWAWPRGSRALIDIRLLRVPSLRSSTVVLLFLGGVLLASSFLLPLFFQNLRGASVFEAGLLMIPQGVGTLVSRLFAGALVERWGARVVTVASAFVVFVTTIPFAFADGQTNLWYLGVFLLLRGVGLGVVLIPAMTVGYLDIEKPDMPHASAITRIAQQLGGAFATALIAVILARGSSRAEAAGVYDAAFWWSNGITLAAALIALMLPGRRGSGTELDPESESESRPEPEPEAESRASAGK